MSVNGFKVNGNVERYNYLSLDNTPDFGTDITNLKNALSDNCLDVLKFGDPGLPITLSGITATKVSDSTYHMEGTITGSGFFTFYANVNTFPDWIKKGKKYAITIDGASLSNVIYFEILGFANGSTQQNLSGRLSANGVYYVTIPEDFVGGVYIRVGWLRDHTGTVVDETIEYHMYSVISDTVMNVNKVARYVEPASYASCDDIPCGEAAFVSSYNNVLSIPDAPSAGFIITLKTDNNQQAVQVLYPSGITNGVRVRNKTSGTWTSWMSQGYFDTELAYPSITDLNDISRNCCYFVSTSGGVSGIDNYPLSEPGMVVTYNYGTVMAVQVVYAWSTSTPVKYRIRQQSTWGSWASLGGGTTTVVQEVSRDTYNNSYDIDVQPIFTTDTNGWLQPVDTNTADETGKTDMTGAIMAMLNSTGYCHLAPGIYYVSGNIDMPADSTLEGCGKKTIIRLLSSVSSGYILRMHTRSTVKGVCFSGGYSTPDITQWNSNIGGRRGINYIGNRDGNDTGVTPTTCTCCVIENCWFENLDSGFYGYNAGGGLQEGVICNNCYFYRCKAGINIDYWTEYCKFTNCITFQCYYACINNGGNNVFTACTFHGTIGFLIDNSSGTKSNCAHGTVNGCTFNHIDNWNNQSQLGKGLAIKVLSAAAGFIFSNCQIWYGRIHIESSSGVQITGCEIGGIGGSSYPVFETSGTDMVFVDNCLFQSAPYNSISSPVKFTNCWTYSGTAVSA